MKPHAYTITLLRNQMETLVNVLRQADINATTLANVLDDLDGYAAQCKAEARQARAILEIIAKEKSCMESW